MKNVEILMLLDNTYNYDRRVFTEAETLVKNGYNVSVVALKSKINPENEIINGVKIYRILSADLFDIKKPKLYKFYANYIMSNFEFDVIHAHDHYMLHLGVLLKKKNRKIKLIYDSHELFHEYPLNLSTFESIPLAIKSYIVRKILIFREKRNAKLVDRFITVNVSLSKILKEYFKCNEDIVVLRNLPERNYDFQRNSLIREKFGIDANKKILIYIGQNLYLKTLNIEQVMLELKNQDNIAMVFICAVNFSSTQQVIEFAKMNAIHNIYFHDRINPSEILTYLKGGDVGILATWNKSNKSYWFALGNKFFEYIQAGIPVLATIQPEHIPILEKYECGVLVNPASEGSFLTGFNKIIENYEYFSQKTREASVDLCWQNESQNLINLYKSL